MESQNIEFGAVIKFLPKESANAKEIHWYMADVYGDRCPTPKKMTQGQVALLMSVINQEKSTMLRDLC